jgi:hypothetical protein
VRRSAPALVLCLSSLACAATDAAGDGTSTSTTSTSSTSSSSATTSGADASTTGTTTTSGAESTSTGAPEPATRVLFIGNSYTFVNDLPAMVEAVADGAGHPVLTSMIAVGGATLADHVANPEVTTTLAEGWDVVVVQGQSVEPIVQTDVFVQGAVDLAAMVEIGTPGAALLLYETWARRAGDPVLDELGMDAAQMQQALTAGYADAATASMGTVAPVGQTWALALTGSICSPPTAATPRPQARTWRAACSSARSRAPTRPQSTPPSRGSMPPTRTRWSRSPTCSYRERSRRRRRKRDPVVGRPRCVFYCCHADLRPRVGRRAPPRLRDHE